MQPAMMPQGFVVAGALGTLDITLRTDIRWAIFSLRPGPGQGNQPNQMQQYGNMYPGQQGGL